MREIKFRAWDKKDKKIIDDFIMTSDGSVALEFDVFDADVILMQYTGLHDKNGKEIYENDIVRYATGNEDLSYIDEIVEFKGGAFYPICNQPSNTFEVIGNSLQNPDLLKGD